MQLRRSRIVFAYLTSYAQEQRRLRATRDRIPQTSDCIQWVSAGPCTQNFADPDVHLLERKKYSRHHCRIRQPRKLRIVQLRKSEQWGRPQRIFAILMKEPQYWSTDSTRFTFLLIITVSPVIHVAFHEDAIAFHKILNNNRSRRLMQLCKPVHPEFLLAMFVFHS